MNLITSLQGRLRNTKLPENKADFPLFEAVINSIQGIEEAIEQGIISKGEGKIDIEILRLLPELVRSQDKGQIIGFKISDNGIGFNDHNLQSFMTLDSDYKKHKGCRGIGRLLWLKAYNEVKIKSIYKNELNQSMQREFTFNIKSDLTTNAIPVSNNKCTTEIILDQLQPRYLNGIHKELDSLANHMFEHCLWHFIAPGGAPQIVIHDGNEQKSLQEVYEQCMLESKPELIRVGNHDFELTHVRLNSHSSKNNIVAYCAGRRLVLEKNLNGKIPGLHGRIKYTDQSEVFIYGCYVTSQYLDDNVRPERTGFDIDEKIAGLLPDTDLAFQTIENTVLEKISTYLDPFLRESRNAGKERVEKFVEQHAPRYRPIMSRIAENKLYVDPQISNKDLDARLHEELSALENQLIKNGHDLMKVPDSINPEEYRKKLSNYLAEAASLKQADLANYVSHRKVIIDLFEKTLEILDTGKYEREEVLHELIMPMVKDSNEIFSDECNLWLIDERLAFHNYLASDKTLRSMPITGSSSTKEPDLCVLNVYDNPILVAEASSQIASLTIVELKRPMRNDAAPGEEKDPIEQTLGYIKRIRNGNVTTAKGRPINNAKSIPAFCYIICDLTDKIIERCDIADATLTHDGLGYFYYHQKLNVYVEIISFDGLVKSAKERNRAFFDKLGLPTT